MNLNSCPGLATHEKHVCEEGSIGRSSLGVPLNHQEGQKPHEDQDYGHKGFEGSSSSPLSLQTHKSAHIGGKPNNKECKEDLLCLRSVQTNDVMSMQRSLTYVNSVGNAFHISIS